MSAGSLITNGAKAAVVVGGAAVAIPEVAVGIAVVGAVAVVGGAAWMLVAGLTGQGISFKANRDGVGVNVGPGNQNQAEV